jgi:hypothetical protein
LINYIYKHVQIDDVCLLRVVDELALESGLKK